MVDATSLPDKIIDILEQASHWLSLKEPGDVIQCPPSALCEGEFYVMGFNPGTGKPKDHDMRAKSLRVTTEELFSTKSDGHPLSGWNKWNNLKNLADRLSKIEGWQNEDWQQKLFITNLFPDASGGVSGWLRIRQRRRNHLECVQQIWPIHQLFLSVVRPRYVIVHGQGSRDSAFRYLWEYLEPKSAPHWDDTMAPATKEDKSIKSFVLPALDLDSGDQLKDVTFIGIRHLSRAQSNLDVMVEGLIKC